jgi:hypothetical protein
MIKTKDGRTKAMGSKAELMMDFMGTAESLMRRTKITAEELIEAVNVAKIADMIDEEEDVTEAEDKPAEATVLEADDIDGMLEWLKGELEEMKERFDD